MVMEIVCVIIQSYLCLIILRITFRFSGQMIIELNDNAALPYCSIVKCLVFSV